jgi:hypothetical protein
MRRALLVTGVVVSTVGVVAGAVWGGLEGGDRFWPVTWVSWAPVGALILWKRPGNGVGRAMLGVGVAFGLSFLLLALAYSPAPLEIRVWLELANALLGALPWLGIMWLLVVFPTGRLAGSWERIVGIGIGLLGLLAVVAFVFSPVPMEATGKPSPVSTDWAADATGWFVGEGGFGIVIAVVASAIVSLTRRFRESTGIERHQYRWLLFGALVFLVILALGQIFPEDGIGMYLWLLAGSAMPVSVGVAVTRYRLFEIDRLLSRTVSYTVVVGLLASLFALVVVGIPNWIPGVDDEPLLVAAATLAVAALFNPVRRRVQIAVDRRFNRSRYDAERVMDEFAGRLREQLETDGIADGWAHVVSETMQPVSVGIWVRS